MWSYADGLVVMLKFTQCQSVPVQLQRIWVTLYNIVKAFLTWANNKQYISIYWSLLMLFDAKIIVHVSLLCINKMLTLTTLDLKKIY